MGARARALAALSTLGLVVLAREWAGRSVRAMTRAHATTLEVPPHYFACNGSQREACALAQQWRPVFFLHPWEEHYPALPDQLRCEARHVPHATGHQYLFPPLHAVYTNLSQMPVLFRLRSLRAGWRALTYVVLYQYNAPHHSPWGVRAGEHQGDVEQVTLYLAPNGTLAYVWFNRHQSWEGELRQARDVQRESDGRPVVYVALRSHAHYATVGEKWRFWGLGDDYCCAGTRWDPPLALPLAARDTRGIVWGEPAWQGGIRLRLVWGVLPSLELDIYPGSPPQSPQEHEWWDGYAWERKCAPLVE